MSDTEQCREDCGRRTSCWKILTLNTSQHVCRPTCADLDHNGIRPSHACISSSISYTDRDRYVQSKRSPLAEARSAWLLAFKGLRRNLLDLVGHGGFKENMGGGGGETGAGIAPLIYCPDSYDARCVSPDSETSVTLA